MNKSPMNKIFGLVVAMAVAVLILPLTAFAGEKVSLKIKYQSGRSHYVEVNEKMNHVIENPMMPNGKMEQEVRRTSGVIEKVKTSSKDGAEVQLTYDRVASSFDAPMMGKIEYDSDMPNKDSMLKNVFQPMVGMSMLMQLDNENNVKSFSGMEAIVKKMEESAGGNPIFNQMKSELNDESAGLTWGASRLAFLPNRKVEAGDTWKNRLEEQVPQMGVMVIDYDCKLDRITNDDGRKSAIIVYKGTISQDPEVKPSAPPPGFGELKIEKGTFNGTATFDVQRGQIIKDVRKSHVILKTPQMKINANTDATTTIKSLAEREKEKKENKKKAENALDDGEKNE